MTGLVAFNTSFNCVMLLRVPVNYQLLVTILGVELYMLGRPNLQAPRLFMANLTTRQTLNNISFLTLISLMPHPITLETKLLATFKTLMCVLSAKDASLLWSFIWTVSCHVAEFFAVSAFKSRVGVNEVPRHLFLKFGKCIALSRLIHVLIDLIRYSLSNFLLEVSITLQCWTTGNNQVWIPGRHCRDIVPALSINTLRCACISVMICWFYEISVIQAVLVRTLARLIFRGL